MLIYIFCDKAAAVASELSDGIIIVGVVDFRWC
jgi:hypothetical protein